MKLLDSYFKLTEHKTNVKTEVIAGITTFLTMAYIIFVNPSILSEAGMDYGAVFVATCIAAAIGCFVMGLWANYPIAQAPGMGLNAFFTYGVVLGMGYTWEAALGAVFFSGLSFFLLSIFRIREWIINSIPMTLRLGIAAGIGLFLAMIALKNAGIVVANPATFVSLGDLSQPPALYALLGFFVITALSYLRVTGAVMIGILGVTVIAMVLGHNEYGGLMSMPPSIAPTFMAMDLMGALDVAMLSVIFAFLFVDLFDTSGTLVGVAHRGKLLDKDGKLPRLGRAMMADSAASMAGAALGTSTTTSYIESTAGIASGGRTGLTAVVVGGLFLISLFFAPLAGSIPAYATAGALLYVAVLMTGSLAHANWEDPTDAAPVLIAALAMPLTFSIAEGIALGFISYVAIKTLSGRFSDLNPAVIILALLFAVRYLFLV
ncbi:MULTISPECIES: NCS2 family permease [Halomonadaceae]|jgi:AGZA family xanthine/uracil permease-like MFS transporter|uniref:NCS2 family permease n=1 Tax=Vreelandella maris TaxID=2729617 RepID=A0A7Y6V8R6_9GAMM|nr:MULTISPECIES: NCS2 family permease [Halomonas]AJY50495.1 Xanthine/uracil/vitamin C permease [Halomonas sp. KO116]NVF14833.1 NCS2 family permease [Halomonas maris]PKG50312.1 NCS2 family permease [Halomonas sp. MES3-P3E]|tara:strand:- start:8784 stop:10082 length:1299 start_codon:yes stop_codon:yes gene_type:complete